jgi:hypothetical protein
VDYDEKRDKIIFYGDHCWVPYFGSYFDEYQEFETADTRDVDFLDISVEELIYN